MKSQINPAFAVIAIVVVVLVVGFFLWRGSAGGAGSLPQGAPGHAGPFSPGGVMTGKSGRPADMPVRR